MKKCFFKDFVLFHNLSYLIFNTYLKLSEIFFSPILYLMKLTLLGETPSKKNSRVNTRSGRSFPNQRYMKWHNKVVSELHVMLLQRTIQKFEGVRVKLTVTFFHSDLKRRDSDNQLSSILDTLVDAGILEDDNWKIIPRKVINDEYDKGNPRCEIEIEEFKKEVI